MIELEVSVKKAREELARIDAELWDLRQRHHVEIVRDRQRHEQHLRDLEERFFYEKESLEKHRDAIARTIIDVESMKATAPRIILETPPPSSPDSNP